MRQEALFTVLFEYVGQVIWIQLISPIVLLGLEFVRFDEWLNSRLMFIPFIWRYAAMVDDE